MNANKTNKQTKRGLLGFTLVSLFSWISTERDWGRGGLGERENKKLGRKKKWEFKKKKYRWGQKSKYKNAGERRLLFVVLLLLFDRAYKI